MTMRYIRFEILIVLPLLASCTSLSQVPDADLQQALQYRQHQMPSIWAGEGTRSVTQNSTGVNGPAALQFRDGAIEPVLGQALLRTRDNPEFVLPLLASEDPEVVLTALWLLDFGIKKGSASVAAALHAYGTPHKDVRIRWKAMELLYRIEAATPADVDAAMRDTAVVMHELAAHLAPGVQERVSTSASADADRRLLAKTYLDCLASDDWLLRQIAADGLEDWLAKTWRNPSASVPAMPNGVVLAQSDWKSLRELHDTWAAWLQPLTSPATPVASQ
jgi:hypothetical protein